MKKSEDKQSYDKKSQKLQETLRKFVVWPTIAIKSYLYEIKLIIMILCVHCFC